MNKVQLKRYKKNHKKIFGTAKGSKPSKKQDGLRLERHKREITSGRKDEQYYLDHEVRVSANPNHRPPPTITKEYKTGWNRIFKNG